MERMEAVTWVLEAGAFHDSDATLREAVLAGGHAAVPWDDDWWTSERWPRLEGRAVVFHGSLGNADRIAARLPWRPGAWCATSAFLCSKWYPEAREWLVHREWRVLPASRLVADPGSALREIGATDRVFVRPDSPLKPFSGRVLAADAITLRALDHGFYYDDPETAVVIAPVQRLAREWRYVVVSRRVIAGSAYAADGRTGLPDDPSGPPWRLAEDIAERLEPPEDVYVLDLCEAEGELRLVELNPFSGADLYGCNRADVVAAVSRAALRSAGAAGTG